MEKKKITSINDLTYQDFEIKEPYPQVTTHHAEPETIQKIIRAYVGNKGEMTAINQYMYQHFITVNQQEIESLNIIMEKISITEMHHLELLSELLVSMGIDPKYCVYIDNNENICSNWSANSIKYIKDVVDFLEYDITLEQGAIREYNEILNCTSDDNIKEIIQRIILDEKSHLLAFETMLKLVQKK